MYFIHIIFFIILFFRREVLQLQQQLPSMRTILRLELSPYFQQVTTAAPMAAVKGRQGQVWQVTGDLSQGWFCDQQILWNIIIRIKNAVWIIRYILKAWFIFLCVNFNRFGIIKQITTSFWTWFENKLHHINANLKLY